MLTPEQKQQLVNEALAEKKQLLQKLLASSQDQFSAADASFILHRLKPILTFLEDNDALLLHEKLRTESKAGNFSSIYPQLKGILSR